MRPHGSPAQPERRRMLAVELLKQGLEPHVIAGRVGVDRRSVRRWKRACRKRGVSALKARPASGRPSKLSARERQSLTRWILNGAEVCGFPTALWTCRRVVQLIRRHFQIDYHPHHVPRLLRSCGFTPQRPETRAKEGDDQRVRLWIHEEWSRAKKNFPGSAPGEFSWMKPGS